MLTTVFMPKASMSMAEGTLTHWLKKEGDTIEAGEAVVEIETDKTTMEVESEVSGILIKKIHAEGDTVPVTTILGYIGRSMDEAIDIPTDHAKEISSAAGEPAQEPAASNKKEGANTPQAVSAPELSVAGKNPATPAAKTLARERGIAIDTICGSGPLGVVLRADVSCAIERATAEARNLAREVSVDVDALYHTMGVQVRSEDVKKAAEFKKSPPVAASILTDEKDRVIELNGMRRTIAKRMSQSHTEVPPVTMSTIVNVTSLLTIRNQVNDAIGQKIGVNDFILKATALALKRNPYMNATYGGNTVTLYGLVHIGMAVAVDNGLIVPVIRNCDRLSIKEISACTKELAAKAREGRLTPADYEGGTFTVSNLGMFGITSFTPIINLPQAAILGVCAARKVFAPNEKGEGHFIDEMELCATFDHRVIDGALCARFLSDLKELIENPLKMLL